MTTRETCRVCGGKDLAVFFDLGAQPLANSLLDTPREREESYPLALAWCRDCSLVQLTYTVPPEKLFSEYVWVTGTSGVTQTFARTFFEELRRRAEAPKGSFVLEIASNDGTFLLPFMGNGFTVLGVDPAKNIVEMAREKGVPTERAFFGAEEAKWLLKNHGPALILFARNVLPHVAHTRDFVEGLSRILDDEGTLAIECHYAKVIQEELHYDSIYHEHLCYFTVKTLERLLNDYGLFVFDIIESPISGGSIIVYARKKKIRESDEVKKYRIQEANARTNDLEKWQDFATRAYAHRDKFIALLREAKRSGDVVVGWGAPARSSTLLNFCGITSDTISYIADKNPLKQGKFTAGSHIPIESPEKVLSKNPAVVVILAWNFGDEIIEALKRQFHFTGSYILPLPHAPRREKA